MPLQWHTRLGDRGVARLWLGQLEQMNNIDELYLERPPHHKKPKLEISEYDGLCISRDSETKHASYSPWRDLATKSTRRADGTLLWSAERLALLQKHQDIVFQRAVQKSKVACLLSTEDAKLYREAAKQISRRRKAGKKSPGPARNDLNSPVAMVYNTSLHDGESWSELYGVLVRADYVRDDLLEEALDGRQLGQRSRTSLFMIVRFLEASELPSLHKMVHAVMDRGSAQRQRRIPGLRGMQTHAQVEGSKMTLSSRVVIRGENDGTKTATADAFTVAPASPFSCANDDFTSSKRVLDARLPWLVEVNGLQEADLTTAHARAVASPNLVVPAFHDDRLHLLVPAESAGTPVALALLLQASAKRYRVRAVLTLDEACLAARVLGAFNPSWLKPAESETENEESVQAAECSQKRQLSVLPEDAPVAVVPVPVQPTVRAVRRRTRCFGEAGEVRDLDQDTETVLTLQVINLPFTADSGPNVAAKVRTSMETWRSHVPQECHHMKLHALPFFVEVTEVQETSGNWRWQQVSFVLPGMTAVEFADELDALRRRDDFRLALRVADPRTRNPQVPLRWPGFSHVLFLKLSNKDLAALPEDKAMLPRLPKEQEVAAKSSTAAGGKTPTSGEMRPAPVLAGQASSQASRADSALSWRRMDKVFKRKLKDHARASVDVEVTADATERSLFQVVWHARLTVSRRRCRAAGDAQKYVVMQLLRKGPQVDQGYFYFFKSAREGAPESKRSLTGPLRVEDATVRFGQHFETLVGTAWPTTCESCGDRGKYVLRECFVDKRAGATRFAEESKQQRQQRKLGQQEQRRPQPVSVRINVNAMALSDAGLGTASAPVSPRGLVAGNSRATLDLSQLAQRLPAPALRRQLSEGAVDAAAGRSRRMSVSRDDSDVGARIARLDLSLMPPTLMENSVLSSDAPPLSSQQTPK